MFIASPGITVYKILPVVSWREAHSSTGRLITGGGMEARHGAENKIEHNSLNFKARSPKFRVAVALD